MKTSIPGLAQQKDKKWLLVDADGKVLGRLAASIAALLRGKHKPTFVRHADMGDHVVVVNVAKMKVTGQKMEDKMYYSHSGYPGALKAVPLKRMMVLKPSEAFRKAVEGMIPRNSLRKVILKKLHVYAGAEHKHVAQQPVPLDL